MEMGKAAVFIEPYHFEMRELPPPPVEPGAILVKVKSAGICGSDLHMWRGEMKPPARPGGKPGPIILGHENTGVVHTLGKGISTDSLGRPLKEGDRIAYTYYFPCRRCYHCLRREFNLCPNRFRYRRSVDEYPYCNGGYSDYYYLYPEHFVFKVPDELPDEAVTAVNCALSQVIFGFQKTGFTMGDSVVVQGAGGLGINATAVARDMGAGQIIVIDGQSARLALAKQCGADETINLSDFPTPESRVERVKQLTDGRGADIVVEVAGYPEVFKEGLGMTRIGGTYLELGILFPESNVTLDVSKILWGPTYIVTATHYDPYVLPVALDFLVRTRDRFPLTKVLSHRFPLEQIDEAFKQAEWLGKSEETAVMRAVLIP